MECVVSIEIAIHECFSTPSQQYCKVCYFCMHEIFSNFASWIKSGLGVSTPAKFSTIMHFKSSPPGGGVIKPLWSRFLVPSKVFATKIHKTLHCYLKIQKKILPRPHPPVGAQHFGHSTPDLFCQLSLWIKL